MGSIHTSTTNGTSKASSFYMPAEHEQHARTLMAFPELPGVYECKESLEAARREVIAIAKAISEFEPVWLYCTPSSIAVARKMINNASNITIKAAEVDNLWMRDLGPVFVRSRQNGSDSICAAIDWNFNYWGSKCEPTVDQHFARRILEESTDFPGVERQAATVISEGGALEVDGDGTLLVTDSSIVNNNRNRGKSRDEIESELKRKLGVTKVIWLKGVKDLESTDWHVDAFARFVAPGHVLLSKPGTDAHPDIQDIYNDAVRVFDSTTDAQGRRFKVSICQEPDHAQLPGMETEAGTVTSYVNYLLVNGGVIMAKFGDEVCDKKALEQMKGLFPERRVVQVYINELPRLGGGIHCATQHMPA